MTPRGATCLQRGCNRYQYRGGYCTLHCDGPPAEKTCDHLYPVIMCGCCDRRVCSNCWGHWKNLACVDCKERARGRAVA